MENAREDLLANNGQRSRECECLLKVGVKGEKGYENKGRGTLVKIQENEIDTCRDIDSRRFD